MWYKDYPRKYIGDSDEAKLSALSNGVSHDIKFGEDDVYLAYIVDGDCDIPSYYDLVLSVDNELIFRYASFYGDKINVYRAGVLGCIIQVVNEIA